MEESKEAVVTRTGALSMQVCVPENWTDGQVKIFADTANYCGTTNGWAIRKEGDEALAGKPERNPCAVRSGFVHITLDA